MGVSSIGVRGQTERVCYYNPVLDPRCREKMTPEMLEAVQDGTYDDGTSAGGGPLCTPDPDHSPNLVSSLCDDGLHRPALDLDFSATLVESSTPGHFHLYLDVPMEWEHYVALLDALADAGILEAGYVAASKRRGQTLLRPPGVVK